MDLKICPKHNKSLVPKKTQYGIRFSCPLAGCTVACWDGSTSTPADYQTRQARISAHTWFDQLWQSGLFTRGGAYKRLAAMLDMDKKDVHIGMFDYEKALTVRAWAQGLLNV